VDMLKDLPLPSDTTVHALAVVPTINIPRHSMLEASLELTETSLKESGIRVATEIKGGVPAATINDYAGRHNPDLIVIGAKGLRATLGILLGGVAQQVVEYSSCPVLVVRTPYQGIKRVLVLTDGSFHSQCALVYLGAQVKDAATIQSVCEARLPLPPDVEILLMHVLPPIFSADMAARSWMVAPDVLFPMPVEPIDEKDLQEEEQRQGQALLDDAQKTLISSGYQTKTILGRGDAATEIIEYVKANQIDLVVCGSRGLSQELNPECEHLLGDMRRVRLGRTFDTVFIHDAVVYMTSQHDLAMAVETAFIHCKPGGAALFAPDEVKETFKASTSHGGGEDGVRSARYLEWVHPPSGNNTHYSVDYAYLLQDGDGSIQVESDHHMCGLFSRQTWLNLLDQVGFNAEQHTDEHGYEVFIGKKH